MSDWHTVQQVLVLYPQGTEAALELVQLQQALPQAKLTPMTFTPHQLPTISELAGRSSPVSEWSELRDTCPFEAAIIFTQPHQSPLPLAYLCYLIGIPLRLGQSREFGGGVLSHCIEPPLATLSLAHYYHHLLKASGLSSAASHIAA